MVPANGSYMGAHAAVLAACLGRIVFPRIAGRPGLRAANMRVRGDTTWGISSSVGPATGSAFYKVEYFLHGSPTLK